MKFNKILSLIEWWIALENDLTQKIILNFLNDSPSNCIYFISPLLQIIVSNHDVTYSDIVELWVDSFHRDYKLLIVIVSFAHLII